MITTSKKVYLNIGSILIGFSLLAVSVSSFSDDAPKPEAEFAGVKSLRGDTSIADADSSATVKRMQPDIEPIARNYFQQPPMIPHRTREYKITVRHNKCMTCHGWDTYKKAKATKVSQTHFADRDGNAQSSLAARRYFCTQCHAPQVDAEPLVENLFTPVHELEK